MTIDWILGIIGTALGGLNVFQFVFWKSERKKLKAEADSAQIDAEQKKIDLEQDQFDYLLEKLSKYQEEYYALADKMNEEVKNHNAELKNHMVTINNKCNEIAELKSKLIYFKGLRCYKTDCPLRIKSKKDEEKNSENIGTDEY